MTTKNDFMSRVKSWGVRLVALLGSAGIGAGAVSGCGSGPDPVHLAYIAAAQSGYETVIEHADIGLDARSNPTAAEALGIPFIADPTMTESLRTNFRSYGTILNEMEAYERGTLDPDAPITPAGPDDGGE